MVLKRQKLKTAKSFNILITGSFETKIPNECFKDGF